MSSKYLIFVVLFVPWSSQAKASPADCARIQQKWEASAQREGWSARGQAPLLQYLGAGSFSVTTGMLGAREISIPAAVQARIAELRGNENPPTFVVPTETGYALSIVGRPSRLFSLDVHGASMELQPANSTQFRFPVDSIDGMFGAYHTSAEWRVVHEIEAVRGDSRALVEYDSQGRTLTTVEIPGVSHIKPWFSLRTIAEDRYAAFSFVEPSIPGVFQLGIANFRSGEVQKIAVQGEPVPSRPALLSISGRPSIVFMTAERAASQKNLISTLNVVDLASRQTQRVALPHYVSEMEVIERLDGTILVAAKSSENGASFVETLQLTSRENSIEVVSLGAMTYRDWLFTGRAKSFD